VAGNGTEWNAHGPSLGKVAEPISRARVEFGENVAPLFKLNDGFVLDRFDPTSVT
jgi:hypothetical protein